MEAGLSLKNEEWATQTNDRIECAVCRNWATKQSIENEQALVLHKKLKPTLFRNSSTNRPHISSQRRGRRLHCLPRPQTEVKNIIPSSISWKKSDAIENEIEPRIKQGGELNLKDMPAFKKGLLDYLVSKIVFSQGYGKTLSRRYRSFMASPVLQRP